MVVRYVTHFMILLCILYWLLFVRSFYCPYILFRYLVFYMLKSLCQYSKLFNFARMCFELHVPHVFIVVSIHREPVSTTLLCPGFTDNCRRISLNYLAHSNKLICWFVFLRLMVNLTQPAVLCFGNNIPDDKTGQHYYLDIVTQLQSYKEVPFYKWLYQKLPDWSLKQSYSVNTILTLDY